MPYHTDCAFCNPGGQLDAEPVPCEYHEPTRDLVAPNNVLVRRLKKRTRQNRWVKAQRKRVPLEVTLEKRVVELLEAHYDCLLIKVGLRGWPDRLVLLGHGRHCWFEFKRRKFGSLTPAQRRLIPKLKARGEHVHIVKTEKQAIAAALAERKEIL